MQAALVISHWSLDTASQALTSTAAPRNHDSIRLTSNHPPYLG
ncbi:MAG TPA: hypothetical protein V6C91_07010 [Coleofasciculaceae cyanobacterium]